MRTISLFFFLSGIAFAQTHPLLEWVKKIPKRDVDLVSQALPQAMRAHQGVIPASVFFEINRVLYKSIEAPDGPTDLDNLMNFMAMIIHRERQQKGKPSYFQILSEGALLKLKSAMNGKEREEAEPLFRELREYVLLSREASAVDYLYFSLRDHQLAKELGQESLGLVKKLDARVGKEVRTQWALMTAQVRLDRELAEKVQAGEVDPATAQMISLFFGEGEDAHYSSEISELVAADLAENFVTPWRGIFEAVILNLREGMKLGPRQRRLGKQLLEIALREKERWSDRNPSVLARHIQSWEALLNLLEPGADLEELRGDLARYRQRVRVKMGVGGKLRGFDRIFRGQAPLSLEDRARAAAKLTGSPVNQTPCRLTAPMPIFGLTGDERRALRGAGVEVVFGPSRHPRLWRGKNATQKGEAVIFEIHPPAFPQPFFFAQWPKGEGALFYDDLFLGPATCR